MGPAWIANTEAVQLMRSQANAAAKQHIVDTCEQFQVEVQFPSPAIRESAVQLFNQETLAADALCIRKQSERLL